MRDIADHVPGLERVKTRFLEMLAERKSRIAAHAVAAWDADTVEDVKGNLSGAQGILHQISGTAGSLGFPALGNLARNCETEILQHFEGPNANQASCPEALLLLLDEFTTTCDAVLEEETQNIFAPDPEEALI